MKRMLLGLGVGQGSAEHLGVPDDADGKNNQFGLGVMMVQNSLCIGLQADEVPGLLASDDPPDAPFAANHAAALCHGPHQLQQLRRGALPL